MEDTTERCAQDTESFKICGKYGASAKVGFEWEQEFYDLQAATKYYKLSLDVYTKQAVELEGYYFMDRLYSNKTNIDLEDFKSLLAI